MKRQTEKVVLDWSFWKPPEVSDASYFCQKEEITPAVFCLNFKLVQTKNIPIY